MYDLLFKNAIVIDGTNQPAFAADVAIESGLIQMVDRSCSLQPDHAHQVVDAQDRLLTPGFVDIHTHYDGQVCWDKQVTPSAWHGVTTVIMGNCGVGFAPVRPGTEGDLVALMESVEDIPGTALHDGISWDWESFSEYLDVIDTPYTIDIGTQVPHVAVRHYVMGDRSYHKASIQDIEQMQTITRQALEDGALGFSTSRFYGHVDKSGKLIPGTNASAQEMCAIGEAFKGLDHGTIEIISDHLNSQEELDWIEHIIRTTGRPVTALATSGEGILWSLAAQLAADGFALRPQVGARPASILMTLEGTINPMRQHMAYREIQHLPVVERQRALLNPTFRHRVLTEAPILPRNKDAVRFMNDFEHIYVLDDQLSYEPTTADSIAAIADSQSQTPLEVIMDSLAAGKVLLVFFRGYNHDLEPQRKTIEDPLSVFGLSDGGAHCGVLVDASVPTYMLSYFTRDRQRGPHISLPLVIHKMTQDTAQMYGLSDRGVISPGFKADLNLIDYADLKLLPPEMVYDLPAGGKRLIQKAQGYLMTVCAGEITYRDGEHTGAMPGRLIRGGR